MNPHIGKEVKSPERVWLVGLLQDHKAASAEHDLNRMSFQRRLAEAREQSEHVRFPNSEEEVWAGSLFLLEIP